MKYTIGLLAFASAFAFTPQLCAQEVAFQVLHDFGSSRDASIPYGPLMRDLSGNLYGVTVDGGSGQCSDYGCGAVFELSENKGQWSEKILHSFAGAGDGSAPWGGLLHDGAGNIYGTLQGDLSVDVNGIFELKPSNGTWNNALLYTGVAGPGLVFDRTGNLFGDIGAGQYKLGAIGELSPGSTGWAYTDLYSYCRAYCPDGTSEPAPPIRDSKGNLWGVTTYGGISGSPCSTTLGCGVIFEMTPNNNDGTWTYHVMHKFASSANDGQQSYGSLVMDSAGNFYGSTWLGGRYNHGTIFKFSRSGGHWKETILYDFPNCLFGCMTDGTLARDSVGNLYGTAAGGTNSCAGYSCGVVFKLAPQPGGTWKYSVLYDFSETSGGLQPFYGVILDGKGHLFGVTSNFGKYGGGTAFEITP
jgi:uncharacterized repeat protein (TIGR03803 family)